MTELWSLHSSWSWAAIRDIATVVGGGTPSTGEPGSWENGDIPWLTPADLSGYLGKTIGRGERNITQRGLEESGARLMPAGTVLMSSRAPIGYVAVASNPVSTNQGFKSFILDEGISPDYIYYYLQRAKPLVLSLASGTTFLEVSGKNAAKIPVAVAPSAEQQRIIEAIESYFIRLDAGIATLEQVKVNLKRYRASVLKAAVEGRLVPTEAELARKEGRSYEPASVLLERILKERRRRWEEGELAKLTATGKPPGDDSWKMRYAEPGPPDTSGLPELPEGWCWTSIEQLASDLPRAIQSGPFGSSLLHSEFQKTGKLVVGIDNVQDGVFSKGAEHRISEEKYAALEKYRARPGDVLITVMATVGRCCIVPDDLEPAIITKHVYRITPNPRLVASGYLFICLWGGPAVRRQMFGQVRGQTRPGLNGTIIKRLSIPLPPLCEQQRILEAVDMHMSEATALHSAVRTNVLRCQRLRQSILKWAFEGKLVDHDATDEPSSVLLERIKAERQKTEAEAVRKAGGSRKRETA